MIDIRYSPDHVWVRLDDDGCATVGISQYAQEQLGDIVFIELPEAARELAQGEEVVITRRGKEVAKLVPAGLEPKVLPDLSAFRASLSLHGEPVSKTVIEMRRKSRY